MPENLFAAAASNGKMLQVVFIAILIGVGLVQLPETKARPLLDFFDREVRSLPGVEPEVVARVAGKALTEKRPRAQYLVGPGARKMRNLARLPVRLRDRLLYSAIYGKRRR